MVLPKRKGKVWGSRVDILDDRVIVKPKLLEKTLKEKGLM